MTDYESTHMDRTDIIDELEKMIYACDQKGLPKFQGIVIKRSTAQEIVKLLRKQEMLTQKMWNALYKAEDEQESKYVGTENNDNWYMVWQKYMQHGFGIALGVVVEELEG